MGRAAPAARGRLAVTRSNSGDLHKMGRNVRGGRKPEAGGETSPTPQPPLGLRKPKQPLRKSNSIKFSARNFMSHQIGAKIEDFYALDSADILGEGAFGEVMSCVHLQSGEARAVKRMDRDSRHEEYNEEVIREFKILRKLDHPNLLKVYDLFEGKLEYSHWWFLVFWSWLLSV